MAEQTQLCKEDYDEITSFVFCILHFGFLKNNISLFELCLKVRDSQESNMATPLEPALYAQVKDFIKVKDDILNKDRQREAKEQSKKAQNPYSQEYDEERLTCSVQYLLKPVKCAELNLSFFDTVSGIMGNHAKLRNFLRNFTNTLIGYSEIRIPETE